MPPDTRTAWHERRGADRRPLCLSVHPASASEVLPDKVPTLIVKLVTPGAHFPHPGALRESGRKTPVGAMESPFVGMERGHPLVLERDLLGK